MPRYPFVLCALAYCTRLIVLILGAFVVVDLFLAREAKVDYRQSALLVLCQLN